MKCTIKIPKDGYLKMRDILICEHLAITVALDGSEVEVSKIYSESVYAYCHGILRRIPIDWVVFPANKPKSFEKWIDDATAWHHDCDDKYEAQFSLYDMKRCWDACLRANISED